MRLNRGGQPDARAQVEGPQVKYIFIKGLKIPPQGYMVNGKLCFVTELPSAIWEGIGGSLNDKRKGSEVVF